MSFLITIYILAALLLALYAFNAWLLTILYYNHRDESPPSPPRLRDQELPPATVQLPVFNEALVVERLIDSAVALDYPDHLLQIQVLDDSTDETSALAQELVDFYRSRGVNIALIHRTDRTGFKAGALSRGLESASGEIIAIFDADFVPRPDFLRHTVPYFATNPRVGIIQTRWGHLNRWYSWLTAAQALALDGHFAIEQTARNRSGLLINFNGTAGLWRRSCIEEAGGWQGDTISEDFDLSYRAQLVGWHCLFLRDVVAPAEIPPQLAAFKRQQFRWAKGSIQCLKKLAWPVTRASLAWPAKLQALLHLSSYMVHPLMVVLALITPILMMGEGTANIRFPLLYLSLLSLGPPILYFVAQYSLSVQAWKRNYRAMPLLILLGSGIALSNTKAVLEALFGVGSVFRRTPKFNVNATTDRWQNSRYRLPFNGLAVAELAFAGYSLLGAWFAAANGHLFAVPFILLYGLGFGYVGWLGVWDARLDLRPLFRLRRGQNTGPTRANVTGSKVKGTNKVQSINVHR